MTAAIGTDIPARMAQKALIAGCSGPELTAEEQSFFCEHRPCGLILFARNCVSREQIARLVDAVRECVADKGLLILVDQEGGRVQRMGPPQWRKYPAARAFARLYEIDRGEGVEAARSVGRLMAHDLHEVGINTDCAPVLDVPAAGAHEIIGDRAYGDDPDTIIALARAFAEGLLDGGVLPIVKHIPGHGRARSDSHKDLPVVGASLEELSEIDFKPFVALNDLPLAMTAHVVFSAVDDVDPASVSAPIITQVIRNQVGFDGLLMSDDLDMAALTGTLAERAKGVIGAGCDAALHCSGVLAGMEEVAAAVPELNGTALMRLNNAFGMLKAPAAIDVERAEKFLEKAIAVEA